LYKICSESNPDTSADTITLNQAVAFISVLNDSLVEKSVVLLKQGTYTDVSIELPVNTDIVGGIKSFELISDERVITNPRAYPTIFDGGDTLETAFIELEYVDTSWNFESVVDGIEFINSSSSYGAVVFSSSYHYKGLEIKNCTFANNSGSTCGALQLFNVSQVTVENCIFYNNSASVFWEGQNGGSAIRIIENTNCGVDADIVSCVFAKNSVSIGDTAVSVDSLYGTLGTISITGGAKDSFSVDLVSSTFFDNNSNEIGGGILSRETFLGWNGDTLTTPINLVNCVRMQNYTDSDNAIILGPDSLESSSLRVQYIGLFNGNANDPVFRDTSNLIGPDSLWGTRDDGLQLNFTSPCRNASIFPNWPTDFPYEVPLANRDACDRLRKAVIYDDQGELVSDSLDIADIGAYECYLNVFPIGGTNTLGNQNATDSIGGYSYQGYLKVLAKSNGYLIDFVGTSDVQEVYSGAYVQMLGEDPGYPNSIGGIDMQMTASKNLLLTSVADVAEDSIFTAKPEIENMFFDFALVMMGAGEYLDEDTTTEVIAQNVVDFCDDLAKSNSSREVIVSNLVYHKSSRNDLNDFVSDFNTAVVWPEQSNMHKCTDINGVTIPNGTDSTYYISDFVLSNNYVTQKGHEITAKMYWEEISTLLNE